MFDLEPQESERRAQFVGDLPGEFVELAKGVLQSVENSVDLFLHRKKLRVFLGDLDAAAEVPRMNRLKLGLQFRHWTSGPTGEIVADEERHSDHRHGEQERALHQFSHDVA